MTRKMTSPGSDAASVSRSPPSLPATAWVACGDAPANAVLVVRGAGTEVVNGYYRAYDAALKDPSWLEGGFRQVDKKGKDLHANIAYSEYCTPCGWSVAHAGLDHYRCPAPTPAPLLPLSGWHCDQPCHGEAPAPSIAFVRRES